MRSAALIFGLLAALLGGAAIAYSDIQTGLASSSFLAGHGHGPLLAEIISYLVPVIGLIGAALALPLPRTGGLLLLLSAAGWVAVAFVAGHGAILFAAIPFTFAAAGGLVALFARKRPGRELEPRRQIAPEEDEEEPPYAPRPRGLRGRSEPEFAAAPSPRRGESQAARYRAPEPEPFADDEPPEEDYIDADEAIEAEEVADDFFEPEDEQALEQEDGEPDEAAEDLEAEESDEPRPAARRQVRPRQSEWSLPDPEQSPAPQRARQRYVPERQEPVPSRRQPAALREEPVPARRGPPTEDFDLSDQDFAPARRDYAPRPRNDYREFEPYQGADPRARRSPLGGLLRLLVLLLFLLVVAAIAAWVYLDYEKGPKSILFGTHQSTASVAQPTAAPTPTSTAPVAPPADTTTNTPLADTATADTQTEETPAAPAAVTPSPAAAAAAPAAPATASAATPAAPAPAAAPADAASSGISDAFKYCQTVDTTDAPDSQYSGPAVPPAVVAALGGGAPSDQMHWRCANQDLLACNSNHGAACDLTPTVDLMLSYCAEHPDTKNIPAPNGSWSCNGKRPVIPRDQKWPVDGRGFFPGAWTKVNPPTSG